MGPPFCYTQFPRITVHIYSCAVYLCVFVDLLLSGYISAKSNPLQDQIVFVMQVLYYYRTPLEEYNFILSILRLRSFSHIKILLIYFTDLSFNFLNNFCFNIFSCRRPFVCVCCCGIVNNIFLFIRFTFERT